MLAGKFVRPPEPSKEIYRSTRTRSAAGSSSPASRTGRPWPRFTASSSDQKRTSKVGRDPSGYQAQASQPEGCRCRRRLEGHADAREVLSAPGPGHHRGSCSGRARATPEEVVKAGTTLTLEVTQVLMKPQKSRNRNAVTGPPAAAYGNDPDRTRTCGLGIRNPALYPPELRGHASPGSFRRRTR